MRGLTAAPAQALLLGVLLCGVPALGQPRQLGVEQLSPEERELLDHGRIVIRRRAQLLGQERLYGGTSWQRIKASPAAVWSALLDTPRYRYLLPEVTEARLLRNDADKRLVFLRHGNGFVSVQYHLVMNTLPDAHALWFYIDRRRDRSVRRGRGSVVVHPYGDDQSVVIFNVYANISGSVLTSLLRPRIQEGILRAPWTMKRYIEGRGRRRYQRAAERDARRASL